VPINPPPLLGLRWAIKRSFLDYIERSPGGRGSLADGAVATADREIVFAPDARSSASTPDNGRTLAFRGTATFIAYSGALLVPIANPEVRLEGTKGELTVVDPFHPGSTARLRFASFAIDDHLLAEGFEHWAASDVRLASEGCALFNNVYPDATPLEPLTIIVRGPTNTAD